MTTGTICFVRKIQHLIYIFLLGVCLYPPFCLSFSVFKELTNCMKQILSKKSDSTMHKHNS